MIVIIFFCLLILYRELWVLKIRRNRIKSCGKLIEIYNHDKKEKVYNYFLSVLSIIYVLLMRFQFLKNIIFDSVILVLVPIVVIVLCYNRLSDIYIYEHAIIINGRYIPWNHIESVQERKSNIIIIKVKKEFDTPYLEIKSRGINQVHKLKANIIKNIQE